MITSPLTSISLRINRSRSCTGDVTVNLNFLVQYRTSDLWVEHGPPRHGFIKELDIQVQNKINGNGNTNKLTDYRSFPLSIFFHQPSRDIFLFLLLGLLGFFFSRSSFVLKTCLMYCAVTGAFFHVRSPDLDSALGRVWRRVYTITAFS